MSANSLPFCRRTDAVLALHLDGDVGGSPGGGGDWAEDSGFDFVCMESLHDHLLGCSSCQQQLQRARRLDAVLAGAAGRTMASGDELQALEQRWLAATVAAPAPALPVAATAHPHLWWPAAVLALAAAACLWLFTGSAPAPVVAEPSPPDAVPGDASPDATPPASAVDPAPIDPAPIDPAPIDPAPIDPATIVIAEDAIPHRAARERAAAERGEATVRTPVSRAAVVLDLRARCSDGATAPAERLAAMQGLLAMLRTANADADLAGDELIGLLAAFEDRGPAQHLVYGDLIAAAQREPRFVAHLQRRLGRLDARHASTAAELRDLATITVAARVGAPSLDAAIVRIARRGSEIADTVAAALRGGVRSVGGANLLLAVWHDLAARGGIDGGEFAGQSWFAGQPDATFAELQHELRCANAAPRRIHCLLALGFCPDDSVVPVLLDRVEHAPHAEAHAAAFALSRLPHRCLSPLLDRARDADAFLLRAALARAGLAETAAWVDGLALHADERERLHAGTFDEFTRIATWFRDHALAGGDD